MTTTTPRTTTAGGGTHPVDEVVDLLKTLRLPHMRRNAPDLLLPVRLFGDGGVM